MKVLNAFSLQMLPEGGTVKIEKTGIESLIETNTWTKKGYNPGDGDRSQMKSFLRGDLECCIGHQNTCDVLAGMISEKIGNPVSLSANRVSIALVPGEEIIVAQYIGPRLPEGATELPEGAKIEFLRVTVLDPREEEKKNNSIATLKKLRRVWQDDFEMGQGETHEGFIEVALNVFGVPYCE